MITSMLLQGLFSNPIGALLFFVFLVISLDVHEFAHAWVADHLGDPTAKLAGRLTLNPLAHLDPIGTIALLLVGFGWGKPVPFDPYNLKNPRRDSALISLAGPASNILFAMVLALIYHFFQGNELVTILASDLIFLNLSLAVFNFIPIHPLDGGKILVALAPPDLAEEWDSLLHRYGLFILILLILPLYNGMSPLSSFMTPIVNFLSKMLLGR